MQKMVEFTCYGGHNFWNILHYLDIDPSAPEYESRCGTMNITGGREGGRIQEKNCLKSQEAQELKL